MGGFLGPNEQGPVVPGDPAASRYRRPGSTRTSSSGGVLDTLDPATRAMIEQTASQLGRDPEEVALEWGFGGEEGDFLGYIGERKLGPWKPSEFGPGALTDYQPYVVGNEFDELADLSTEELARWQQKMMTLGLLDPDQAIIGVKDAATTETMKNLLSMANAEGVPWGVMLQNLESIAGEDGSLIDEDKRKFTAPSYMAPDYATLAQRVKATMRETLGRDPDEAELAALVGELQGWDRQAYEQEVAAARSEFDAQEAGVEQPGGSFTQVDPLARFQESFEQKYAKEIDFVEERDEVVPLSQESIGGGVGTLSNMSRDA